MYSDVLLTKPVTMVSSGSDHDPSPVISELTKKTSFFRFLQKEISTAKTEAEREAVFGILMKTKIQIRELQMELKRIQKIQQPRRHDDSRQTSDLYTAQRMQ